MKLITILALSLLVAQPVFAKTTHHSTHHRTHSAQDQNDDLIEQGDYINSDGNKVHRPAHTKSHKIPEGATAKCSDDSYSFSQHHRGTCSRHGGVAEWLS